MSELVPIGSIIRVKDRTAVVVGFTNSKEEKASLKYLVVPYPAGYLIRESLRTASVEDAELLHEGYKNSLSEDFIEYLSLLAEAEKEMTSEELQTKLFDIDYVMEEE